MIVACLVWVRQLRWNASGSMPKGIYRVVQAPLKKGTIVSVCLPLSLAEFGLARQYIGGGDCPGHYEPVVKEIIAMSGDVVQVARTGEQVNGHAIPHSSTLLADESSRPLPAIARGNYSLQAGQVWLYGNHDARSWDSRYYGAISTMAIQNVVKPLLTW